jgi:4-amino-4-deoxy-L-arabinose transferase-like glycosyltransferase
MNPAGSRPWFYQPRWLPTTVARLCVALTVLALLAGTGLRVVWLDRVPPGLHPDEACDGYDAYSILTTGSDQHGNFLPITIQAFDDYRMPLFDYSLIPLIAAFGLKTWVVRLGAALWGIADMAAIAALGGVMLGWPGAATAALLAALSPWHLALSRYGIETTAASASVSLAMLAFLLWVKRGSDGWLMLSGLLFGLSLYTYAILKAFVPLMIGLLALLYRTELRQAGRRALVALAIVVVLAAPQAAAILSHPAEAAARFNHLSVFNYMASCPNCDTEQAVTSGNSLFARLAIFGANWISYFTPSYLFVTGDRGDHWTLVHPPGFGQLLPEQAILIGLVLIALFQARHRRVSALLAGWLLLAALPAAMLVPLGAWQPQAQALPTPWIFRGDHAWPNVPLTPSLLLAHPDSRHDALAMAPWTLLSALGLVALLESTPQMFAIRAAIAGLLLAGAAFDGARFVRSYFVSYPVVAAPYFQYGVDDALTAIESLDDGHEPIVIPSVTNQPYIYVLFFDQYPAERFQHASIARVKGKFLRILEFDRYLFVKPDWAYAKLDHGIFVFPGNAQTPAPPALAIRYPDGSIAYQVVVKSLPK